MGYRDEAAWSNPPAPLRSMSYSGESMGGHQQPHYVTASHGRPYDRRGSNFSDMYSAPVGAAMAGMAAGPHGNMDPTGHLSPASMSSSDQRAWQAQAGLQRQASFPAPGGHFTPVTYGENAGPSHHGSTDRNHRGPTRPY